MTCRRGWRFRDRLAFSTEKNPSKTFARKDEKRRRRKKKKREKFSLFSFFLSFPWRKFFASQTRYTHVYIYVCVYMCVSRRTRSTQPGSKGKSGRVRNRVWEWFSDEGEEPAAVSWSSSPGQLTGWMSEWVRANVLEKSPPRLPPTPRASYVIFSTEGASIEIVFPTFAIFFEPPFVISEKKPPPSSRIRRYFHTQTGGEKIKAPLCVSE